MNFSDGLWLGYVLGALMFGWRLPWLGKKLKEERKLWEKKG